MSRPQVTRTELGILIQAWQQTKHVDSTEPMYVVRWGGFFMTFPAPSVIFNDWRNKRAKRGGDGH